MSNTPRLTFEAPEQLHTWLRVNHASETELWVRIFKKATGQALAIFWHALCEETLGTAGKNGLVFPAPWPQTWFAVK